jgi:hypothetical protein
MQDTLRTTHACCSCIGEPPEGLREACLAAGLSCLHKFACSHHVASLSQLHDTGYCQLFQDKAPQRAYADW